MNPGAMERVWRRSYRGWGLAVCLGLVLLAGCAGGPGVSGGTQADLITSSDESEARRRARIRLELAANYFQLGRTEVALDEAKQALANDPDYADAHTLRGLIYMRLGDFALAEDGFRKALSLQPRDADLLHNYGWLLCQQRRYPQADRMFTDALSQPRYPSRSKTWMAKGLCQQSAGQLKDAQESLFKAYEMDAGNPVIAYNLASVLHAQGDAQRARFYIRRLNNSEQANAESLWLGIKVEHALGDRLAMEQLAGPLGRRHAESREWQAYQQGAFNE